MKVTSAAQIGLAHGYNTRRVYLQAFRMRCLWTPETTAHMHTSPVRHPPTHTHTYKCMLQLQALHRVCGSDWHLTHLTQSQAIFRRKIAKFIIDSDTLDHRPSHT